MLAKIGPSRDEYTDLCGEEQRDGTAVDEMYAFYLAKILGDADGDDEVGAGVKEVFRHVGAGEAGKGCIREHGRTDKE